ncbi:MAG TPA: CBS domain-containing protein [Chthonomonadaceae bacterium]|nr:CBS domain-containing protein [Chthonomonadaceae bacterium]
MKTHVVTTTRDETLSHALDLMDLYQVDGLPVVDAEGCLCGMLTEQDISHRLLQDVVLDADDTALLSALHRCAGISGLRVADIMTEPAISISEAADVTDAVLLLIRSQCKRLPVTNDAQRVVGTFHRVDVFQALLEGIV